jgi:hypothetical protein
MCYNKHSYSLGHFVWPGKEILSPFMLCLATLQQVDSHKGVKKLKDEFGWPNKISLTIVFW